MYIVYPRAHGIVTIPIRDCYWKTGDRIITYLTEATNSSILLELNPVFFHLSPAFEFTNGKIERISKQCF